MILNLKIRRTLCFNPTNLFPKKDVLTTSVFTTLQILNLCLRKNNTILQEITNVTSSATLSKVGIKAGKSEIGVSVNKDQTSTGSFSSSDFWLLLKKI